jgi:predicted outer membrane repeat protein
MRCPPRRRVSPKPCAKADLKFSPFKILGNFVPNFREQVANSKNYKLKTKQKGMTPMNTQMKTLSSNTRRILFATCLSALCLAALSAEATTITVINSNDSGPGSLRQALADANDGDTINFDASVTFIAVVTTELVVDKSVTISGPGAANLFLDNYELNRVFHITNAVTVSISGLTIIQGIAPFDRGGGILNDHSTLTVSNCTIRDNQAGTSGGAIYNDGESGSASLEINNSTIAYNDCDDRGGGIYNNGYLGSATLTINNSSVSSNLVGNAGSGIYNDGRVGSATLTINNSTLSDNSAVSAGSNGGGIYNDGAAGGSATLTVNNSTLSDNSAATFGGGIYNDGLSGSATLTVTNSTISGNSVGTFGGGIYNYGASGSATLMVSNSTVSGNSAGFGGGGIHNYGPEGSAMLEIGDTILNMGSSGASIENYLGTVTSHGYNLSSDNGGGVLTATGDQINTDPMLGPLQDNGGPTFTHALLTGSPAIDAGDPNFTPPPDYDQRGPGYDRVAHGRVDIGAFEVQIMIPSYAGQVQPPINADGTSAFNVRRGVVPVRFTLTVGGVATCDLPPATIGVTRTAGGVIGEVNESVYGGNADTGSNFRIDSCQYVYNLNSRALGVGTYRVDILIDGQVVGSAVFALN